MEVDLSIIIVAWRSLEHLRVCLASVYRHTHAVVYEVIVVDNASGDGSEEIIRREFPEVTFIQSGENLGFARANNLGYSKAHGRTLLFLNPDTEIAEDVFTRMLNQLWTTADVGAAGPRLLNADGSLQMSCVQAFPTLWNQALDCGALRRAFPKARLWGMQALFEADRHPADVDAISGACFMVKRQAFEDVELFTSDYFMYSEDIDLSYKLRRQGYRVCYLPDCELIHYGGRSSTRQGARFVSVHQRESALLFFKRTRSELYCACYRACVALVAALRILVVVIGMTFGRFAPGRSGSASPLEKWLSNFRWAIGRERIGARS